MKAQAVEKTINDIKCYSPDRCADYENFPVEAIDVSEKDARGGFWEWSRHRLFKELIKECLPERGIRSFLEIGCGTGSFVKELMVIDRLRITASDIYIKSLLAARKNCTFPEVEFIQFDASAGPLDTSFDLIAAFDVLEHIDDDVTTLKNIHHMLRPGGHLIISVPQHRFLWSEHDEIFHHRRRYARSNLVPKMRESGFEIIRCTSFVFTLFPALLVARILGKIRRRGGGERAIKRVTSFSPLTNAVCDFFMNFDEVLIKKNFSLPFGGTLIVVAKRLEE